MKKLLQMRLNFLVFLLFSFGIVLNGQTVVKHYTEDFNGEVDTAFWAYNWAAAGLITGDRDGNTFKYETNELNNYFLGVILQFVNEGTVIDLSDNPFISFKAKAENTTIDTAVVDSIPIGMDLIGMDGKNIGLFYTKAVIASNGEWQECTFDFSSIADKPGMDSIAKIRFNPGKDRNDGYVFYSGTVWIDDVEIGVEKEVPPTELTSYYEDFNEPIDFDLWLPNRGVHPDSTPIFTLKQENGALTYGVNQNAFYDGQFFNFTKHENVIFDLTENGYMSVRLKVEPGATYNGATVDQVLFLASPWGKDSTGVLVREVDSPKFQVPADGKWHDYTFDFAANIGRPIYDGTIPPGDLSAIEAILLETVAWPDKYTLTFSMDDFKLGDAAVPPTVLTSYYEDFNEPIDFDLWLPNRGIHPDSTPIFTLTQENGALTYGVNQNAFYDGQFFNFTKYENVIFDLTESGYMSVRLKVEPGATYNGDTVDQVLFLASPWGKDSTGVLVREVDSPKFQVPADGKWHDYTFDFAANIGKPIYDGTIPPGDLSAIEAILLETVAWPNKYTLTFSMDDFKLGDAAVPPTVLTSYYEDFNDSIDFDLWLPNRGVHPDGTPIFTLTQEDGALTYGVNQNAFYDGQFFNFTKHENVIFDLTENGYMSVRLKVEPGATYNGDTVDQVLFLASPWGKDSTGVLVREVDSPKFQVPADGEWHDYTFDFAANIGKPIYDGSIPPGDLSAIEAILLETVAWPDKYTLTFSMDDFKLGDAAAPPTKLYSYVEDFEEPIDFNLWLPNRGVHPDSTPIFTMKQENGALTYGVNQNAFYDGQFFNFTKHENVFFDLTGNGYMSVRLKVEPGATYNGDTVDQVLFLASPWGKDSTGVLVREVDAPKFQVPADGEWHDYRFDFAANIGKPIYDGSIPPGDLSAIEAILLETVAWPDKYTLTFSMDDFKLGDAAAPLTGSKAVPVVDGKFWAQVKVTPSHSPMNAGVGLSQGEVENWGDMGAIVRFNTDGFIDVRNGANYEALASFPYSANTEYEVEFIGDASTQTYSVSVKAPGEDKVVLATDYKFRTDTPQNTINYISYKVDDNTDWGGVIGSSLRTSFVKDDYILGWNTTAKKGLSLDKKFNAKFDLTPTGDLINAGFAFSNADPALLGWGDLSAIIRFNDTGFIDVRDGNTYNADNAVPYEANKVYSFNVDVDLPAHTYTVSVTPDGGSETVLASDYAFRKVTDTINFLTKLQLIGGQWGGAIGDLIASNIEIKSTSVNSLELVKFDIYPNPVSNNVMVTSEEAINKIIVTDMKGAKLMVKELHNNKTANLNVSSLEEGSYIINVVTEKGMSARVMVKK